MSSELSRRLQAKMEAAHRTLGMRLHRVRDMLDGNRAWEELGSELEMLRRELEQHFVLEETECYMKVEGMDPVQWDRIRGLAREHEEMLAELARIQGAFSADLRLVVRADLAVYLKRLSQHERAEERIVQEAYGNLAGAPQA